MFDDLRLQTEAGAFPEQTDRLERKFPGGQIAHEGALKNLFLPARVHFFYDVVGVSRRLVGAEPFAPFEVSIVSHGPLRAADRNWGAYLGDAGATHYSTLRAIDTTNVAPMPHPVPAENVFREDVEGVSLPREAALANAPKTDGQFFLVPKILEEKGA